MIGNFLGKQYPLDSKPGYLSCQPLFIISSGRSGTTLLRSMLVAGGQIAIPAETHIFHILPVKYLAYRGLGWEDLAKLMIAEFESSTNFPLWQVNLAPAYKRVLEIPEEERSLAKLIDEVILTYAAEKFPEAKMWGDQSPIHTFFLPHISNIFPEAKYIHMLRDGRDVVTSRILNEDNKYDIYEAVYRWKTSIDRANEIQKRVSPDQYLEIRYERLVTEPIPTLKEICGFLNIEYSPIMLDYWKLPSTIEHKYYLHQKNLGKPVFTSSIGKWRECLTYSQQNYVLSQISGELRDLGYLP